MAFEADKPDVGTDEHLWVIGSVRFVTCSAVAYLQWGVFEDEGAAFFGVTAQTRELAGRGGADLARVEAAVLLMAVGAAHRILGDLMVVRLCEVGPALDVAAHAEGVGALLEEAGKVSAAVDGVAVGAGEA